MSGVTGGRFLYLDNDRSLTLSAAMLEDVKNGHNITIRSDPSGNVLVEISKSICVTPTEVDALPAKVNISYAEAVTSGNPPQLQSSKGLAAMGRGGGRKSTTPDLLRRGTSPLRRGGGRKSTTPDLQRRGTSRSPSPQGDMKPPAKKSLSPQGKRISKQKNPPAVAATRTGNVVSSRETKIRERFNRIGKPVPAGKTIEEAAVELGEGLSRAILSKSKDFKEYCLSNQVTGFEAACLRRLNQSTPTHPIVPPVRVARSATLTGRSTTEIQKEPETEPKEIQEEGVEGLIHTSPASAKKPVQAIQTAKSDASSGSISSEKRSKELFSEEQS
jgi:hypothetical protein